MTAELKELVQQAQPDVSERRLAGIYAEALLNAAQSQHIDQEILQQLREITVDVGRRDPYVRAFFTSGVIGKERRQNAIKGAFENRVHPMLLDFLYVLNDHDRLQIFRSVYGEMQKLDDLRHRRFRVTVESVTPLAVDQKERLMHDLRATFRLEPILDERTDADLLGGMVVRVSDWVFDGSVRTQLVSLRKQLREMSSHEIQSRRDRFSAAEGN